MGIGQGRAKLLLLGEHAAVHGHIAVGFSLPRTLTVTHTPGGEWNQPDWGLYAGTMRIVIDELSQLAAERGLAPPVPGRLDVISDIAVAGGFGSSAALCVALVGAFFPGLDATERDELAWRAEHCFHGTPSGIDTALASREGWWVLEPGSGRAPAQPYLLPNPRLNLVVGSVNRSIDTKTLVASVSQRLAAGDGLVREAIDGLGTLAREAVARIKTEIGLSDLIVEARSRLRALGLETPSLTAAIDEGLACPGALAGKLSGAGGGGAFFILFEDADSARAAAGRVTNALPETQWKTVPSLILP